MSSPDARKTRRTLAALVTVGALACVNAAQRTEAQGFAERFAGAAVQSRRPVAHHPLSRRFHEHAASLPARNGAHSPPVSGPLFAVLSLAEQHISVYNGSGLVARSKVSTGMPGHRTPAGVFSIIGRERWHRSNIYSGAPMPFMQRITWSGIALHLGVVPGYPASHGCIRLPSGFAERLWGMTRIGERVVVTPHEAMPVPIVHAKLPVPKMQPVSVAVGEGGREASLVVPGTIGERVSDVVGGEHVKMLNPIAYAQLLKTRAAADASAAAAAIKEAERDAAAKADDERRAAAQLRSAERDRLQLEERLRRSKARDATTIPQAKEAAAASTPAEQQLNDAAARLITAAQTAAAEAEQARGEAERILNERRAALLKAQTLAKEAASRTSPLSILVSKKDKRIFLRQALAPVLEAPAVVRDPDIALGTHLYLATGLQADGQSLSWTVISLPAPPPPSGHRGARRENGSAQRAVASAPSSTAAEALDRIDISPEIAGRISELLWIGASLIISDQPLSDETGDIGTDLVVTMR